MTFECPQCHWSRSYAPESDVLYLPNWAQQCPKCGHEGMQVKPANVIAAIIAHLLPIR
jgi:Zn finger protein HypA/HybF involved in hydrogenase expression